MIGATAFAALAIGALIANVLTVYVMAKLLAVSERAEVAKVSPQAAMALTKLEQPTPQRVAPGPPQPDRIRVLGLD